MHGSRLAAPPLYPDAVTTPSSRLAQRREAVQRAWGLQREVVLVPSGLAVPITGTDQFHDYHAHNEHTYLAGTSEPGSLVAFDPEEGWTLFARVPSREERIWTGDGRPLDELAERA